MLAPPVLPGHLPVADLNQRSRGVQHPVARGQWQSIWLVRIGRRSVADADARCYSVNEVRERTRRFRWEGSVGVGDRLHLELLLHEGPDPTRYRLHQRTEDQADVHHQPVPFEEVPA